MQIAASPALALIDILRDDLGLTGTKQSCDRKGQCGTCTVIINGKAVRSCITRVGSFENASIFLDSSGGKVLLCGSAGDFMQLYVKVVDNVIADIKYLCFYDPTANVAVEILRALVKGKTMDEDGRLTEQAFYQFLGSAGKEFGKKATGLLKLFHGGIATYRAQIS